LLAAKLKGAIDLKNPATLAADLKDVPPRSGFTFTVSDPVVPVTPASGTQETTGSLNSSASPDALRFETVSVFTRTANGEDSLEAKNFRTAAIGLNQRLAVRAPARTARRFDMANANNKLSHAIDPNVAFPKLL